MAESQVDPKQLSEPLLFLSSEGAGWANLAAYAYHEPTELEGWISSVVPDHVLVLFTRGTMLIEQQHQRGWQAQHFRQGDLLLTPGGSFTREIRWRSLSAEPMQTLHLHLSRDLVTDTAAQMVAGDPADLALVGQAGFQDPLLMHIGLALQAELERPTSHSKFYAQSAAQLLAVHLLRHYSAPLPPAKTVIQGLTRSQINTVRDYVLCHLKQDLSLAVLAQQVGFSPYHFTRLFRHTMGESPHQFVVRQRLDHAKHLLTATDLPLAYIALECGFANQSHLTLIFKRHVGMTPAHYRKTDGETK